MAVLLFIIFFFETFQFLLHYPFKIRPRSLYTTIYFIHEWLFNTCSLNILISSGKTPISPSYFINNLTFLYFNLKKLILSLWRKLSSPSSSIGNAASRDPVASPLHRHCAMNHRYRLRSLRRETPPGHSPLHSCTTPLPASTKTCCMSPSGPSHQKHTPRKTSAWSGGRLLGRFASYREDPELLILLLLLLSPLSLLSHMRPSQSFYTHVFWGGSVQRRPVHVQSIPVHIQNHKAASSFPCLEPYLL